MPQCTPTQQNNKKRDSKDEKEKGKKVNVSLSSSLVVLTLGCTLEKPMDGLHVQIIP
jgi:hypothetical protein